MISDDIGVGIIEYETGSLVSFLHLFPRPGHTHGSVTEHTARSQYPALVILGRTCLGVRTAANLVWSPLHGHNPCHSKMFHTSYQIKVLAQNSYC